jgi:hypothetical protein
MRDAGIVPELQQSVAANTLKMLPGQARIIAEKKAALKAIEEAPLPGMPESQLAEDTKSFLKSFGGGVLGAYLGSKGAELAGMTPEQQKYAMALGGIMGSRARAGKALRLRLGRPQNQFAMANAANNYVVQPAQTAVRASSRALPAAVAAMIAVLRGREQNESNQSNVPPEQL